LGAGFLSTAIPSWGWNFVAVFSYSVPETSIIPVALDKGCWAVGAEEFQEDFCLSNDDWRLLSNGLLSSYNPKDVAIVNKGLTHAKEGGLILNIMARDVVDAIPALTDNLNSLKHFFGKMTVVIFENDSIDGTREAIVNMKEQAVGYNVDIMSCEEEGSTDCHLGHIHRYDKMGDTESAVGRMARYPCERVKRSLRAIEASELLEHPVGGTT